MLNAERLCPGCMKDNGGKTVCDFCGYDLSKNNPSDKLPVKFIIRDRYFVGKILYSDLTEAVYLGYDTFENRAVNIREYFPENIASRNPDKTVFASRENQFCFNKGLMEFVETYKKLIGFPVSALPSTYNVFEENSTAYAVCDTFSGITLKSFLSKNGGNLKWEQARPLFLPLIDTVKSLHGISVLHGCISPDTVFVCRDGKLRLKGVPIESVKKIENSYEQYGKTDVKCQTNPGYWAAEQYGLTEEDIGEYTDVYGVCSTLFTVLIGAVPPSADERLGSDKLTIPAHFADELPRQVLVSLANGMQINPKDRTRNIETLKNELIYGETKENIRKEQRAAEKNQVKETEPAETGENNKSGLRYAAVASGITAGLFLIVAIVLCLTVFKDQIFKKAENLNNDDVVSIPSHDRIGDVDSDALESKILYTVPDLKGKYYAETIDADEYEHFKIVIKGKEYSKNYEKGLICEQSINPGESVEHNTVIELKISLGPEEMRMIDVTGLSEEQAMIELLRAGFLYENIDVPPVYDTDSKPGTVLRQEPERGETVNTEIPVKIFVNSYEGDEN